LSHWRSPSGGLSTPASTLLFEYHLDKLDQNEDAEIRTEPDAKAVSRVAALARRRAVILARVRQENQALQQEMKEPQPITAEETNEPAAAFSPCVR